MKITVISSNLNKNSSSRIAAEFAYDILKGKDIEVTFLDLREYPLPLCCAEEAYDDPNLKKVKNIIKNSDSIIISTPIYNKDVNAALKNLLDLAGRSWSEKIVGMICSAGGPSSYMALMPFANSLMLNFRCLIIPKFVYASEKDFNEVKDKIINKDIMKRIEELCNTILSFTLKLS